jgi:hypothetical protein
MSDEEKQGVKELACEHPVRVNVDVDDAPVEICIKCKRVTGIYWRDDLNK